MTRTSSGGPAEDTSNQRTSADDTRVEGTRFRRLYGASPWHLVALVGCFALTGYAASRLLDDLPVLVRITIWFVGAAVVWDLLLGPLVALVDRLLRSVLGRSDRPRVSPLNYVRVPLLLSALLLLVWAPLVLQRSEGVFRVKAGLLQDPYLERWLAVSGVLAACSAAAYALALLRAGRRR
jgi:hypothetical protein